MTGIMLAMLLLVSPADEVRGAEPAGAAIVDTRPRLKLPHDLVTEPSRPVWRLEPSHDAQATAANRPSTTARVIGAALGGLGGFYAGGMIGFYVAQDRDVYGDGVSGLRGVVIGAPVGAALGALIGYKLVR